MKRHPVKWVAKYIDGQEQHQYKDGTDWIEENKQFPFKSIDYKKLAILSVVSNGKKEIARLNMAHERIIVGKTIFSMHVKANGKKLGFKNSTPNYFHHYEQQIGQSASMVSYNLEIISEHLGNYGQKFASSRLIASMPIKDNRLVGHVTMIMELRSFHDSVFEFAARVSNIDSIMEVDERIIYNDKLEINKIVEFDLVDLNL